VVEVGWHVTQSGDEARGEWETVAGAAGHHRGSADPGQPGNCVLSAHSSDAGGAVFRGLETLAVGDSVQVVTLDGSEYTYQVGAVLTLDEVGATASEKREHARWLDPTAEAVLTLVTCWPPWSYTHRIVVRAELD
jgi:LPXTG-site transpeptidase (sortase) family protein